MNAGVFSPFRGEMAAQRSEGIQAGAHRSCVNAGERAVPPDGTPTAAFGGISPSRGEARLR
ncbi:hypothetical protein CYK37_06975 [Mesorhizobium loti]|nr:hypothetical protein CYK37_06975 [Mesorhizobium loti]